MHQENKKLTEVLGIFCYACMNLENQEYNLAKNPEREQIRETRYHSKIPTLDQIQETQGQNLKRKKPQKSLYYKTCILHGKMIMKKKNSCSFEFQKFII